MELTSPGRVRVLWVVKGLGPGGAERLLCAQAGAHDHDRYEIECAYVLPWKDHLAEELERAGVHTRCLSTTRSDPRWPLRLWKLVRDGGWDVVHVHSPLPGSVARAAVRSMPAAKRPRVVATEHNSWATHRPATQWLNRVTSRWNGDTFAVTAEAKDSMSGAAADRAQVLRHGIDVEGARAALADRDAVRAELGIDPAEVVVGAVANFRPQKDYPNLLQAARLLADRDVPVRIVAVGQGPDEAEVRALHAELELGERVLLTGFRDDAVRVMAACDVFTMASQWEGLPVALMEALALGLPVVATAVGGIAEELVDGQDALLVAPRDPEALAKALELVATDKDRRAELARAAAARADEFDVSRAVTTIESSYGSHPIDGLERPSTVGAKTRRPLDEIEIRPATAEDRPAMLELCRASLGWGDDPRFDELFAWKHDRNVFGPSYMWVAEMDGRVVGLRAFMRWEFVRGGEVLRAVRAVDTATHPDVQGRGLFTAMTLHAVDEVRADGVDFVFNTPNDASRPGYLKMGWHHVGRLPAAIRPIGARGAITAARARVPASHWPIEWDGGVPIEDVADAWGDEAPASDDPRRIRTRRGPEFAMWRFGSPLLGYRAIEVDGGRLVARLRARGDAKELVVLGGTGLDDAQLDRAAVDAAGDAGATHALRLGTGNRHGWIPVPNLGPILTWRGVNAQAMPPLSNWSVTMADIELL